MTVAKFVIKSFVAAVVIATTVASPAASQLTNTGRTGEDPAVYASVLNKDGVPVTTLGPSDFVLREDGVEREVVRVSQAADPTRIVVLADTSRAMEPYINDMRHALRSFLREMQGHAEIAIFEFGDRPTRLVDFTRDAAPLEAAIARLFSRPASGSYVLDAIVEASRDLRVRESDRSVILVISAQGPEFSQRYHEQVLDALRASRATLHSVVVTRRRLAIFNDGVRERELTLSKGSELTGGRREDLLTSMSLGGTLNELARELKTQYRVEFLRPNGRVAPARIDVAVRRPELVVRASHVPPMIRTRP